MSAIQLRSEYGMVGPSMAKWPIVANWKAFHIRAKYGMRFNSDHSVASKANSRTNHSGRFRTENGMQFILFGPNTYGMPFIEAIHFRAEYGMQFTLQGFVANWRLFRQNEVAFFLSGNHSPIFVYICRKKVGLPSSQPFPVSVSFHLFVSCCGCFETGVFRKPHEDRLPLAGHRQQGASVEAFGRRA